MRPVKRMRQVTRERPQEIESARMENERERRERGRRRDGGKVSGCETPNGEIEGGNE